MIDTDAVRDSIVARTAHGQCCSCGMGVDAAGFGESPADHPWLAPGSGHAYPWCTATVCADWLVAQELMGRLPHQSTARPRARWAPEGRGYVLEGAAGRLAGVGLHARGWVPTDAQARTVGTWYPTVAEAQHRAEREAVRVLGEKVSPASEPARWVEVNRPGHPRGWRLDDAGEGLTFVEMVGVVETPCGVEEQWRPLVWRRGASVAGPVCASREEAQRWAEREVVRDRDRAVDAPWPENRHDRARRARRSR